MFSFRERLSTFSCRRIANYRERIEEEKVDDPDEVVDDSNDAD